MGCFPALEDGADLSTYPMVIRLFEMFSQTDVSLLNNVSQRPECVSQNDTAKQDERTGLHASFRDEIRHPDKYPEHYDERTEQHGRPIRRQSRFL